MSDVECPYCGADQEINHDDGYGYDEGEKHHQECPACEKTFVYTTYILFSYDADKADCLNGSKHKYEPTFTVPRRYTRMRCMDCGDERPCSKDELAAVLNE